MAKATTRAAQEVLGEIGYLVSFWISDSDEEFPAFHMLTVPHIGEQIYLYGRKRLFKIISVTYVLYDDTRNCISADCIMEELSQEQ